MKYVLVPYKFNDMCKMFKYTMILEKIQNNKKMFA